MQIGKPISKATARLLAEEVIKGINAGQTDIHTRIYRFDEYKAGSVFTMRTLSREYAAILCDDKYYEHTGRLMFKDVPDMDTMADFFYRLSHECAKLEREEKERYKTQKPVMDGFVAASA